MKCDRCGQFCAALYPVYCNPPEGGIDHEICGMCKKRAEGDGSAEP